MPTALRLELNGQSLDLDDYDANGFIIAEVDLGFPAVRVVSDSLPGQDGTDDQTQNFDARTIILSGSVVPSLDGTSRSRNLDALMPYLRPNVGATLVYALDDDMGERCLDFAYPSQFGNPINHPGNATSFTVQLVCPNPIAYEQETNEVDVPFAQGSSSGFTFPFTFPINFGGTGSSTGSATVISAGTYFTWPTLCFFGPCTDPALYWLDPTTGEELGVQVVFSGLVINDGDYLEVDTRNRTAYLNGDPTASLYQFLDFVDTTWGPLQPGSNLLRFNPGTASGACQTAVIWRDTFLG